MATTAAIEKFGNDFLNLIKTEPNTIFCDFFKKFLEEGKF